ncbi:MAG: DNA-directed RNA polymerase subunit beta', partial [Clostridia bacterium]|nr:DNA-directed RNA polymerase subunit beta' [Clostridia bacterium]
QIRQLAGMRGLMADPSGKTIELPVRSSFREGLSVLEYFISSHGGRKGLADTALKTADSGYLTRRLVDVSHSVIVREQDCGDNKGTFITAIRGEVNKKANIIESMGDRIAGRYTLKDVVNPETGEVICEANTLISTDKAKEIDKILTDAWERAGADMHNQPGVLIRSILTCKTKNGVCVKCYGKNMASGNPVKIGESVGIIAAQSIGEPGTQLTMRTFHSGGVATDDDITQGLPRVEELFEARKPKGQAVITEAGGAVSISEDRRKITITGPNGETKTYDIPYNANILVEEGEILNAGDPLTRGSINPQDMLRAKGVRGVQEYIAKEVQSAYRTAGVEINDKHIEVIVRQMLRKVRIEAQGDTNLLPGTLVDIFAFEEENEKTVDNGGEPAQAKPTLLGITKAALATESFLSAASFQETAKVLAEAAINNKVDPLVGLKENVIIGKLIPAGTGMKCYKNITTVPAEQPKQDEVPVPVFEDGEED